MALYLKKRNLMLAMSSAIGILLNVLPSCQYVQQSKRLIAICIYLFIYLFAKFI